MSHRLASLAFVVLASAMAVPARATVRHVSIAAPERAAIVGLRVSFEASTHVDEGRFLLYAVLPGGLVQIGEWDARPGTHRYAVLDAEPLRGERRYRLVFRAADGREVVLFAADAVGALRGDTATPVPHAGPQPALGAELLAPPSMVVTAVSPVVSAVRAIVVAPPPTPPPEPGQ